MGRTITDLSFAGSTISVNGIQITDFMDDANPIDIQDTEVANIEWSCNGRMIRTVKPSSVIISITVIPGSPSDQTLHSMWQRNFNGSLDLDASDDPITLSITPGNPKMHSYIYSNGTFLSGAAGVTANGQGKFGGNTYTFSFESI